MTFSERLGSEMRSQRLIHRLTVRDVAERMGKGKSTIAYWEKGEVNITVEDLVKYCDVVGCSWVKVLENAENEK